MFAEGVVVRETDLAEIGLMVYCGAL